MYHLETAHFILDEVYFILFLFIYLFISICNYFFIFSEQMVVNGHIVETNKPNVLEMSRLYSEGGSD